MCKHSTNGRIVYILTKGLSIFFLTNKRMASCDEESKTMQGILHK